MNPLTDKFIEDFPKNFGNYPVFLRAWDYSENKFNPAQVDYKDIEKFNDIKVWWTNARYSIFFHPNGDMGKASTMKNRKDSDATTLYCLYADFDIGHNVKELQKEMGIFPRKDFILEPTAVVETYNWYHTYRILDTPLAVSIYADRWKKAMKDLASYLNSDPKVTNIARILRMPWCYYWSRKQWETDEPYMVECIEYNSEYRYSLEDFEKIFVKVEAVENEVFVPDIDLRDWKKSQKWYYDDINRVVRAIDVLMDFDSNYSYKWWLTIYEWWKPTSWYKYNDAKNLINDFSHSRPVWGPFAIAKRFLSERLWWEAPNIEIFKYFAERWNVWEIFESKLSIKNNEASKKNNNEEENDESLSLVPTIMDLEWWVDITIWTININISFSDKKVYKLLWDEKSEIMDASIKTLWYYVDEEEVNTYIVEYAKSNWDTWIIYLSKLWKKAELEKKLSEVWISYFGWNGKVEKALVAYIHSCNNEMKLINQLWIYDEKMIVNKCWKYSVEDKNWKRYFCNISDVKPANRQNSEDIFVIWEKIDKEVFRDHIRWLKNVYKESIIYSLFTHYAMGLFAYSIRQQFSRLPSCSLVWTTSAWKTYARRLIMNMLGMDNCMEIKASTTEFSVLTLCKHNVPLSVWEYSNDELRFDRDPMLKNNYDWTANTRWTSNQKLKIYPNNACFCIDWEVWTMTNSVLTRQIALRFNTTFKRGKATKSQEFNINQYLIANIKNVYNVRDKYDTVRRPFVAKEFEHINKAEKERILDNYALLLSFADCFDFIDIVQEPILEQIQTQFDLFWEDMIDKIIKQVFTVAITSKIEVQVIEQKLIIELIMDFMRLNKKRYDDLLSSVQSVNYHFKELWKTDYSWSERLEIPLEYVLKNKSLHPSFNALLDASAKIHLHLPWIEDTWPTIRALREYALANHLEERLFYQRLDIYKNVEFYDNKKPGMTSSI